MTRRQSVRRRRVRGAVRDHGSRPTPGRTPAVLEPSTAIERPLAPREEHRYQLAMTAGEFVSVIVEQRGIDVIVQARRPDGSAIADFQQEIRRQGEEQVDVVADADGTYILAVKAGPGIASGSYAIRVAGRRAATDADRSMQEARIASQGRRRQLEAAARLDEARSMFERALTIAEAVRGPDDAVRRHAAPRPGRQRARGARRREGGVALSARDRRAGQDVGGASTRTPRWRGLDWHCCSSIRVRGRRRKRCSGEASDVIEKTLGTDHPWFAVCLMTQASIRDDAGDYEKAEEIDRRALAIMERIERHRQHPVRRPAEQSRRDLSPEGGLPARRGALPALARCCAKSCEGPESYHVSTALPEPRHRRARAQGLCEGDRRTTRARCPSGNGSSGPDHPDVAPLLNNLANVYHATGDDATIARDAVSRAAHLGEHAAVPITGARCCRSATSPERTRRTGDIAKAIAFQRRADAIVETAAGAESGGRLGTAEAGVRRTACRSAPTGRFRCISSDAAGNPDASSLAALVLLQRKGRVLDAMTDTLRGRAATGRRSERPGAARSTEHHHHPAGAARVERSRRTRVRTSASSAIKDLEARKERLEAELSDHSAELRAQMQPVTLEAVQAAMPDDAALLEFAVFRPFDPKAERNAEAYGPPHYAAYVVRKHGPPSGRDLGAARPIDEHDRRAAAGAARSGAHRREGARPRRGRTGDASAARVDRRRHAAAHLSRWRAQSGAVRGARRRARPVPDRAVRDELSHQRPRSPAACRCRACPGAIRSSSPIRCSASRRSRAARRRPRQASARTRAAA